MALLQELEFVGIIGHSTQDVMPKYGSAYGGTSDIVGLHAHLVLSQSQTRLMIWSYFYLPIVRIIMEDRV